MRWLENWCFLLQVEFRALTLRIAFLEFEFFSSNVERRLVWKTYAFSVCQDFCGLTDKGRDGFAWKTLGQIIFIFFSSRKKRLLLHYTMRYGLLRIFNILINLMHLNPFQFFLSRTLFDFIVVYYLFRECFVLLKVHSSFSKGSVSEKFAHRDFQVSCAINFATNCCICCTSDRLGIYFYNRRTPK